MYSVCIQITNTEDGYAFLLKCMPEGTFIR